MAVVDPQESLWSYPLLTLQNVTGVSEWITCKEWTGIVCAFYRIGKGNV